MLELMKLQLDTGIGLATAVIGLIALAITSFLKYSLCMISTGHVDTITYLRIYAHLKQVVAHSRNTSTRPFTLRASALQAG